MKDRKEVRHDLKFSPCGKFLAVASNDNFVSDNNFHSRCFCTLYKYKVLRRYKLCTVLNVVL